jgi:energy-coupling factor transport system ATP-binding protein
LNKNRSLLFLIKNIEVEYPQTFKKLKYEVDFPIFEKQVVLFTGRSGIGKSTLFLLLNGILSKIYSCNISGDVFYFNGNTYENIIENYPENIKKRLGYLGQNPYTQIVNPRVIDELVFGMENHQFSKEEMNRNAVKFSNLFGLSYKLNDKTKTLSGGYCQRLNLASIVSYEPDIILLDEPVSFLDSNAAKSFYNTIKSIKGEKTIIIIEHLFEQILDIVDNALIFVNGDEKPDEKIISIIKGKEYGIARVSPENKISQIEREKEYIQIESKEVFEKDKEINIKENNIKEKLYSLLKIEPKREIKEEIKIKLKAENVFFRYNRNSEFIFENLNFEFESGQVIGIIGENGCGKSTFLQIVSGILKPEKGSVKIIYPNKKSNESNKKTYKYVSILFQNPESSFFFPLVKDEILHQIKKEKEIDENLLELIHPNFFDIVQNFNRSAFTLSEGEKRRLGFIIQLLMNRPIRLYDEPTYAQDYNRVESMNKIMKYCKKQNILQIIVSHDFDFLKTICDRVYLIKNKGLEVLY